MPAGELLGLEIDVRGTATTDDEHAVGLLGDEEGTRSVVFGIHAADEGSIGVADGGCAGVVGPGEGGIGRRCI